MNEKQLWEQLHTEGEEGELVFGVHRCKGPPPSRRWNEVTKGESQREGEEDGATRTPAEGEAAWPFCGISGARHSIWRDMLPPYATVVTLVVGGGEEDE